jgi:nitrate reductase gamma subunit
MESLLWFLRGPAFRFALIVAVLGLVRELALGLWGAAMAYSQANDKNVAWKMMATTAAEWLVPARKLFTAERKMHGFLSFVLHVGVILVPLLLLDHLLLWGGGLGLDLSFLALPHKLADALTLVTVAAAAGLIVSRAASKTARPLSHFSDYFLLLLIMVIFCTGFAASKPWNPASYQGTMIVHIMCGDLALLLTPFTKLAHIAIFPVLRFSGELAWKFPARAGERVALAVDGKEVRPI